jgi:CheY-like chemotaxis protein
MGPDDVPCPDLSGVHVVVVDDDPDALQLVKRVLEKCNARVTAFATGADCLAKLPALRPTVLITDVGMPGMDGYSLIKAVRALPADQGGDTPAVALTAHARSVDRRRAMLSGFDVHVARPVEPS